MHNVNVNAAISRHDTPSAAVTAPQAVFTSANWTRRPPILIKGGASIRLADASPDTPSVTGGRSGPVAACLRMMQAALTTVRMKRKAYKDAQMRRMAYYEIGYLGDHILRDIGLSRSRPAVALRDASLHGARF